MGPATRWEVETTQSKNATVMAETDSETVKATHEFTLYENDGFVIARYTEVGSRQTIVACGVKLPAVKDVTVELTGRWENSKYGKQLKVEYFRIELPVTKEGILSYLCSLKIGIGKKRANEAYKRFGKGIWDVVKGPHPEQLLVGTYITPKSLERLQNEITLVQDLIPLFKGVIEVTTAKANAIIKRFGRDTASVIQNEPYRLCEIDGFVFPQVDKLAAELGISPLEPARFFKAAEYLFQEAATMGHTCIPKGEIIKKMVRLLNGGNAQVVITDSHCINAINEAWRQGLVKATGDMLYSNYLNP